MNQKAFLILGLPLILPLSNCHVIPRWEPCPKPPFERDFSLNSVVILNIPRHLESKIYLTSSTQTQTGQKEAGAQDVEVMLGSNSHNTNVHTVAQF